MIELSKYDLTSIISDLNQDVSAKQASPTFKFSNILSDSLDVFEKLKSGKELPLSGHKAESGESEGQPSLDNLGNSKQHSADEIFELDPGKMPDIDFSVHPEKSALADKSLSNLVKQHDEVDTELSLDKRQTPVKGTTTDGTNELELEELASSNYLITKESGANRVLIASLENSDAEDASNDKENLLVTKNAKFLNSSNEVARQRQLSLSESIEDANRSFEFQLGNRPINKENLEKEFPALAPAREDVVARHLNITSPDQKIGSRGSKSHALAEYNASIMRDFVERGHVGGRRETEKVGEIQNLIAKEAHTNNFSKSLDRKQIGVTGDNVTKSSMEGSHQQHYPRGIRNNHEQLNELSSISRAQSNYQSESSSDKEGLKLVPEGGKQKSAVKNSGFALFGKGQIQTESVHESQFSPRSAHIETLSGERKILVGNHNATQGRVGQQEQALKRISSLRSDAKKYAEPSAIRSAEFDRPALPFQQGSNKPEFTVEQANRSTDLLPGVEFNERQSLETDHKVLPNEVRYRQESGHSRLLLPDVEIDLTHLKTANKANVQSIIEQRIGSEISKFQSQLRVGVLHDLKIKLYPRELGLINLNIELVDNGDINVKIISATDEANKLIRDNWGPQLQDINTKGLTVEFSERNQSQSKAGSEQGGASDASGDKPGREMDSSEKETTGQVPDDDTSAHSIDITI